MTYLKKIFSGWYTSLFRRTDEDRNMPVQDCCFNWQHFYSSNSVKHPPRDAGSLSAGPMIPRLLWHSKIYYWKSATEHYPKSHDSSPYNDHLRSILILSSHLCVGLPSGFPTTVLSPFFISHQPHDPWLHHRNNIRQRVKITDFHPLM
jgi:hypothetical protein